MRDLMGSRTVATLLTWAILLLFCVIVFFGWFHLFSAMFDNRPGAIIGAAFITLLAAFLARQVGHYRAAFALSNPGKRPSLLVGWQYYLPMAVLAALGTLNAAFMVFESKPILRTDIQTVRSAYGALQNAAHAELVPPGYEAKQARVDALLDNLRREIVNPNRGRYCGVGPQAREIIAEIAAEIPGYRLLNGSGAINPCDIERANRLYQSYADMAHEMLKGDTALLGIGGPERLRFVGDLGRRYDQMDRNLDQLEAQASGLGSASGIDKAPLYSARNDYNADRARFLSLGGEPAGDIPEITRLQSDEVNTFAATFELFLSRWRHLTTWFYLVFAIGLDIFLIKLITALTVQAWGRRRVRVEINRQFLTDPVFIWVPPLQSNRTHADG